MAWKSDASNTAPAVTFGTHGDDLTFGPGASNGSWDQFATNEKMFGIKTSFDEEVYTTKLDRSGPDFKEREREAQRIANEIMGVSHAIPFTMHSETFAVDYKQRSHS